MGVSSRGRGVHRRRIHRRRRFANVAIAIALLPWLVFVAYFTSRRPHSYSYPNFAAPDSEWTRGSVSERLAALAGRVAPAPPVRRGRPVYPYSVVPGGIHDSNELREAIQRDHAVARHYAAFNLHKTRIVELKSPRLVYLSYRLGDKIFWTRKQIKLSEGERLITDGNISARTRCANQVSVLPQTAAVSTEEPLPEQLEDPFGVGGSATHIDFPNSIESAMLRRTPPGLAGEGPGAGFFGPPFGGGGPGLAPPPIPGSCAKPPCSTTLPPPPPPPPPPPAPVPEPGSILLVSSGLAGIYFRHRKRSSNK